MSPDEFALAEAIALKRAHGDRIYVMIAERIGALALTGDAEGIERFRAIAAKLGEMLRSGAPNYIRACGSSTTKPH